MTTLSDLWTGAKRAAVSAAGAPAPQLYTQAQYTDMLADWRLLTYCYTGMGGFRDGTFLVPHMREWLDSTSPNPSRPTPKLIARRKLARYENTAAKIIDTKAAALFRIPPTRDAKPSASGAPHPIRAWWDNVDGRGCHVDDLFEEAWTLAGVLGHVVMLLDRASGTPATKADETAPYVRLYNALDVPDWSFDENGTQLTGLRLLESIPRASIDQPLPSLTASRSRLVTANGWTLVENGALHSRGEWNLGGCVPATFLFARRNPFLGAIGQSVLSDPRLYVDEYNLTSEIRELLRAQTFGMLNIPLGDKTSVQQAQAMIGDMTGASNVLFTPLAANYIQPDASNVKSYQDERQQLVRKIYRLCGVPWESDSRDAEAADALKLKREDMNQILAKHADQCEKADYELARRWFRWTYGSRWEQEWDAAGIVIRYPDTFDVTPFAEILEQAQAATTLEMGPRFDTELKKRLVTRFLPDAPPDVIDAINKELAAAPEPASRARGRLMDSLARTAPAA